MLRADGRGGNVNASPRNRIGAVFLLCNISASYSPCEFVEIVSVKNLAHEITAAVLVVYTCKLSNKRKPLKVTNYEPEMVQDKLLTGISQYLGKPIMYGKEMIMEATMNLDEHCKIGGSIYKGTMYGKVLALKENQGRYQGGAEHPAESKSCEFVKFSGHFIRNDGTCFLVYKYTKNGSLEKWLHPSSAAASSSSSAVASLTWSQRIHIALEVANGLQYMHDHTQPSIVHWDLRAKNILLNSNFKAKIAKFLNG